MGNPHFRLTSKPGKPHDTQIEFVNEHNEIQDISRFVRRVNFDHTAGEIPVLELDIFDQNLELYAEVSDTQVLLVYPRDPNAEDDPVLETYEENTNGNQ